MGKIVRAQKLLNFILYANVHAVQGPKATQVRGLRCGFGQVKERARSEIHWAMQERKHLTLG